MVIAAVIFDLDGVLIDTEFLAYKAWQRKMHELGFDLDDGDFHQMMGLDADQTVKFVLAKTDLGISFQELMVEHAKVMLSILHEGIEPLPGVVDLIRDLARQRYPLAVASNSTTEYVRRALCSIHLENEFKAIVGRDQVANGKPAPDVYLAAAAGLITAPGECLAVEDSVVGIRSAIAAGTRCVAIPASNVPQDNFDLAFAVYQSLPLMHADLEKLLGR